MARYGDYQGERVLHVPQNGIPRSQDVPLARRVAPDRRLAALAAWPDPEFGAQRYGG